MEIISTLIAVPFGFMGFNALTHDNSRLKRRMPNIIIGGVQIFPVIRIQMKNRVIHLHHWFNFSVLLGYSLVASAGILDHTITRGLLIGGILQGLSISRESRKMIYTSHPILPSLRTK